jgi:hypothetical protein
MSTKYPSTKDCRLSCCALAALLLGFIPAGVWAQTYDACGPGPAVKAALDQLPQHTPAQTNWQFIEQRLEATRALLHQYPDDVSVQRAYIQVMRSIEKDKVIAEYKARHEQNPDSARLAYLYGFTLVGRQTPEAVKLFNAALEKDPRFALPHLELVTIYRSHAFLDRTQSMFHLKAFLDACPAALDGYEALTPVGDKEVVRPYAEKLRTLLESRSDPDAVGAYRTLWSLEFKARPASEYDALRRQVNQDIARLRQLELEDKPQWYQALEDGYNLVEDKKQAEWADDQYLTRFPQLCAMVATGKFWDNHMFPGADSPPDKKRGFYSALYEQSGQWLKDRPNCTMFWAFRFYGIENLDDIPTAEVEADVEEALRASIRDDGPKGLSSGGYSRAAEILSKKHLEPERVVELALKGLTRWEIESKEPPDDLDTKEDQENHTAGRAHDRLQLLGYEIDGYLQLRQADKVQVQLEQMDRWLQDFKLLPGKQNSAKTVAGLYAGYWRLRAHAAELQDRKQDAMAFYANALLAPLTAQQKPEAGRKDELADNAHQLWKGLGGTEEGWELWYGRPANDLANQATLTWQDAHEPLPAFELADLNGKTWNLAALKGKTVFLTFWSTW